MILVRWNLSGARKNTEMLTLIALSLLNSKGQNEASALVSKMLAKYHDAKTVSGDLTTNITLGNIKLKILTSLQIERPCKLFLKQVVSGQDRTYTVISDGKKFTYDKPYSVSDFNPEKNARLSEEITPQVKLGDIYRIVGQSIAERSVALDMIISDVRDLATLRDQWASLDSAGTKTWNGETVTEVYGDWRLNKASPVSGKFNMYITSGGELRRFEVTQNDDAVSLSKNEVGGTITRTLDVKVSLDEKVDQALFNP